ncbi:hypothetical protein FDECE_5207 [Fusarium decemcellulare]|nr:hypothetical protein FDECE_5207 [Fusarium decemcellulare]
MKAVTLFAALVVAKGCDQPSSPSCVSGAHIIVVRGSTEPQGPGIIGEVAQKILERIHDSDMVSLKYPAEYDPYVTSQTEGVNTLTDMVKKYTKTCPNTKMILVGFSQGAHIIADVMCGASSDGFPATKPQPKNISNKVAAVVLMGDPSTTKGQPFHMGSSHGDGIFPRQRPGGCQCISDRTVSFCDAGDPFCEAGGSSLDVHMNYVTVYADVATDFAVSMFHRA